MIHWTRETISTLSLAVNFAMLVVWGVYLHVFLLQHRRQARAKIVINWGGGHGLDATCVISNMSSEAIYIEALIVSLERENQIWRYGITEIAGDRQQSPAMKDGPLPPGKSLEVGTFREIAGWIADARGVAEGPTPGQDFAIDVQVIADYASEDLPIGAERRFDFRCREGGVALSSDSALTHQVRSGRRRRTYRQQLEEIAIGHRSA